MYQKKVKKNNEKKILYYLYKNEKEFSINDICKILNLTFPTVKNILDNLLYKNIIKETLKSEIKLGRKAKYFKLNNDFIYGIGVKLSLEDIQIVLINEIGEIKKEFYIKKNFDIINILSDLKVYLEKFLLNIELEIKNKISGIGIGIPGVVMLKENIIEINTNNFLNFNDLKKLEKDLSLKIIIENNCNLSAIGEKFLNKKNEIEDFISLNLDKTISMSLFKENIETGSFTVFSPKIEHMVIDINGAPCICGENGCLGVLLNFKKFNINNIDIFIRYLAIGIKNIIFLYNPEKIIISGFLCAYENEIKEKLLKKIYEKNIFFKGKETILFSDLKNKSIILGSGILPIIDNLF